LPITRVIGIILPTVPTKRPYSPYAADAARLLGARIRLARRERRWSQDELASRIGITPRTVSKIEHGDLSVGLGATFEAAALLGVPLFHAERSRLAAELDRTEARSALLPRPSRAQPEREVKDDF
jgi:transcriptional regulator with XRE-family HTH domain